MPRQQNNNAAKGPSQPVARRTRSKRKPARDADTSSDEETDQRTGPYSLRRRRKSHKARAVVEPMSSSDDEAEASIRCRPKWGKATPSADNSIQDAVRALMPLIPLMLHSTLKQYTEAEGELEEDDDSESSSTDDSEDELGEDALLLRLLKQQQDDTYLESLPHRERVALRKQEAEMNKSTKQNVPLKFQILQSTMPEQVKAKAWHIYDTLKEDDGKTQAWIKALLQVPFNQYTTSLSDGKARGTISDRIELAKQQLDAEVYGQSTAKQVLLQTVAQAMVNPTASPPIIALVGPPGVGKTTLAKCAVATAMDRPFQMISLAGMHDAAFVKGFSLTYEGSRPGVILAAINEAKCMDPVILLDEADKASALRGGQDASTALIPILDPTQNMHFEDDYLGVPIDISRVCFVLTMNDASQINPILRDRITLIHCDPVGPDVKVEIASRHLTPKAMTNVGLQDRLVFPRQCLLHIIERHAGAGDGVRQLKRVIEAACRQLNLLIIAPNTVLGNLPHTKQKGELDSFRTAMLNATGKIDMTPTIFELLVAHFKTRQPKAPDFMYI